MYAYALRTAHVKPHNLSGCQGVTRSPALLCTQCEISIASRLFHDGSTTANARFIRPAMQGSAAACRDERFTKWQHIQEGLHKLTAMHAATLTKLYIHAHVGADAVAVVIKTMAHRTTSGKACQATWARTASAYNSILFGQLHAENMLQQMTHHSNSCAATMHTVDRQTTVWCAGNTCNKCMN